MPVSTVRKQPSGRHFLEFKTCEWRLGHVQPIGVELSRNSAGFTNDASILSAGRAQGRVVPAALTEVIEKQPKNQIDWSSTRDGTRVAIYSYSTSARHDTARGPGKRRRSTALRAKDCENLLLAARQAIRIGKPLNRMLTVHFDKAGIPDPVKATGQLLKLMGDWLRCYDTAITAVWVRESGSAKGEHVHILLCVPPPILVSFSRMQRGWFRIIGAKWRRGVYLSRPIGGSHKAAFSEASIDLYEQALTGALHYLLKGADLEAMATHRISKRGDGGELWGKRCGTTENIGRAARLRSGRLK
jgi:hypothetical protein